MPREPDGYREQLELLAERYPDKIEKRWGSEDNYRGRAKRNSRSFIGN